MELYLPSHFPVWREREQQAYLKDKEKILFEHVYPLLEWNSLLKLRLLSKGTKKLVDKYLRDGEGIKRCPEIIIQERRECEERSIRAYLNMGLRSTAIYLQNVSGSVYFEREKYAFEEFFRSAKVLKKVAHLRVYRLNPYPRGVEQRFYESLVKLESLEADEYGINCASQEEVDERRKQLKLNPNNENSKKVEDMFKRLKKLVLGAKQRFTMQKNLFVASHALMEKCPDLEYAGDAFSYLMNFGNEDVNPTMALGIAFTMIRNRVEENNLKLKSYDFASFHQDPTSQDKAVCLVNSVEFAKLLIVCHDRGIKLYNVNSGWFSRLQFNWIAINTHIISMVNLQANAVARMINTPTTRETMPIPMPNLEKLIIPATSRSCLLPGVVNRMVMPKLRVLEVTVDSELLYTMVTDLGRRQLTCINAGTTENLFKWLFMDIPRPSLAELKLEFLEGVCLTLLTKNSVGNLGTCCPNLKKLILVNWPGSGELLKKALRELSHLEELTLDGCKLLCDDSFEDSNLKNLNKLSLLRRELMPGITEALCKDLLPQLQQLKLTDLKN